MQAIAPIAGAPYTGSMTMTTTVLNSDGKSVGMSRQRTLKWRDSVGRFREEELPPEIQGHLDAAFAGLPHQITAVDTVQHCQFTWSAPVAREQTREAVGNCDSREVSHSDDSPARRMTDPKPEIFREQLGTIARTTTTTPLGKRVLRGLQAVGIRSVTTGLDAEGRLQSTKEGEIWWSSTLYETLFMRVKANDSIRYGCEGTGSGGTSASFRMGIP